MLYLLHTSTDDVSLATGLLVKFRLGLGLGGRVSSSRARSSADGSDSIDTLSTHTAPITDNK